MYIIAWLILAPGLKAFKKLASLHTYTHTHTYIITRVVSGPGLKALYRLLFEERQAWLGHNGDQRQHAKHMESNCEERTVCMYVYAGYVCMRNMCMYVYASTRSMWSRTARNALRAYMYMQDMYAPVYVCLNVCVCVYILYIYIILIYIYIYIYTYICT